MLGLIIYSCSIDDRSKLSIEKDLNNDTINILVAGHVYGAPGAKNKPFHPPFMNFMDTLPLKSIDFTVLTGDIVQESNDTSWQHVIQYINQWKFKTYFAAGNHDLKNRELYNSLFGNPNYYFIQQKNLFYFVDLLPSGWNITKEQMNEISQLQQTHELSNIFIFTHHIPWQNDTLTPQLKVNSTYGQDKTQTFYKDIVHQLNNLRATTYLIAGDVGANPLLSEISLYRYKNVHMIASGMGSKAWDNILHIQVIDQHVNIKVHYLKDHPPVMIDSSYNILHL